ncbi:MAG: O-antigen ligase family protein [Sulfuricaulis sp.]|uniref:O-antigen ligase family protein n=1 Tax=Sulfuricaulis sp. TaxID=2003553 RepID=UPI0025D6CB71|nr:O-antigen ligase family protein [Sulfuricaulis sp.]MCR4346522.1 O-antigen ligase family protein [Sulfuricaulis sp.]
MLIILVYLTTLFIAPQLWIEPFVDMRIDYYVYPLWALAVFFSREKNPLTLTPLDKFFLLMLLWIVLSMAVNGFHERSTEIIINYTKWLVLFKLVSMTVTSADRLRTVALMLVFFALVLAVEGIEHKTGESGLGWAGQTLGWIDPEAAAAGEPGRTRWINIFDGPGVFCVVYTVGLPFVMQYVVTPFGFGTRLLGMGLVGLLLVAIYFTGSRGGFLTTMALFALFIAVRYKVSLMKIALVGGVIGAAFMLAPSHLTTLDDSSKSTKHRVEMWIEGVEMVQHNPLFGIGKGNFLKYTSKLIAHNSSIEIMGETGLPGLFFWIGLIYLSLKNVVFYVRDTEDERDKAYATALGLSVLGYIASSMFVTLEYETFYFLLGLCAALGFRLKQPIVFTERDFWAISGMTVGWGILIKAFVIIYA